MEGLIITNDGVEDSEFSYPYYRLQEAGYDVTVATPDGESFEGKRGDEFDADTEIDSFDPGTVADEFDLLVIPGGRAPEQLRTAAPEAADIIAAFVDADKPVAAICHGVQLLISANVLDGREATGYWTLEVDVENAGATFVDEEVVVDEPLVTSRAPQDLPAFMAATFQLLDHEDAIAQAAPTA